MKYGCLGVIVVLFAVLIMVAGLAFARGGLDRHRGPCIVCSTSGQ